MDEFELIRRYFKPAGGTPGLVLGVGDDCALLQPPQGEQLAVSIDTLVSGVHFPADAEPSLVGERSLRVSLSDLAAMGAKPLWFTLALTLPEVDEHWVKAFSRGLMNAAGMYGCALVGGDTTRGPLTISIQVHGSLMSGRALRRSGAKVDDIVYVTGDLGDGAAALAMINGELEAGKAAESYLLDRFYRPRPQIRAGEQLVGVATAAIDISDGLLADLGHICSASRVGAAIEVERLPISAAVTAKAAKEDREAWALAGGDDYQLCFTVPPMKVAQVQSWIKAGVMDATPIGKIVKKPGVHCLRQGRRFTPDIKGYQHFGDH